MHYKAIRRQRFDYGSYSIVPIRMEDMYLIKQWRNDQVDILRQKNAITDEQQRQYFTDVVSKLFDAERPGQILVSYLNNEALIGYGGLVHIDWFDRRAEVSFLLDPMHVADDAVYKSEFSIFLTLIKRLAFLELGFNRLFTETFAFRKFHISVLEENRFLLEGTMRQHVLIRDIFCDSLIHGCLKDDERF